MTILLKILFLSSLSFGFIQGCTFSKDAKKEEDKKSVPELQKGNIKNLSKELIEASEVGNLSLVNSLLSQGADLNYRDSRGINALMGAVQFNQIEIYNLFLY